MIVLKRISKPTKRNSIITIGLLVLFFSAYIVGNSFILNESSVIPYGFRSQSNGSEAITIDSDDSISPESSTVVEAAYAMADTAKAASGSPFAVYFDVGSTGDGSGSMAGDPIQLFTERLVVFTARLELEVEDLEPVLDTVRLLAESHNGFVATEKTRKNSGYITIRLPQRVFHETVAEIEELGELQSRDLQGQDVTEEYVDLGSRLVNLENQEQRLLEIMEMGTTVESVLKVENELERVRGSIESIKGRLNYLESRVELATITVYLNLKEEEPEPTFAWFPEVNWSIPVRAGLSVISSMAQGMITITIVLLPFLVLGIAGRRGYRYYRARNTSQPDIQVEEEKPT